MLLADYVRGVGHLGIVVPDVDRSVDYYVNKWDFVLIQRKLVIDTMDGALDVAFVRRRNMVLELFTPMAIRNYICERRGGVLDHFAIDCGDVRTAAARLLGKGLSFHASTAGGVTEYPHLGCKGVVGANFSGSAGEVVEVCSVLAKDYQGRTDMEGWSHLALKVRDLSATKSFYERLGFRQVGDGYVEVENGRWNVLFLSKKGFLLEAIQVPGSKLAGRGIIDHVALQVQDVREAFYQAKKEGFEVVHPMVKELNLFDRGVAFFMIKGPDGEMIELSQEM